MLPISFDWIKKHAEEYGFDSYGFMIYKYFDLYITVDIFDSTIISFEVKE